MAGTAMLLLATCMAAFLAGIAALDLTPSFGHVTLSNEGGQVVEWDGYPESAGFNLAAYELTLNENSILFPGHYDTDTIFYVVEGSAKLGLVFATGKRYPVKTVSVGDVILLPREANYWFYNDGKSAFKIWGGGDASNSLQKGKILRVDHVGAGSVLQGFTTDVLAAGFNVDPSVIEGVVSAQKKTGLAKLDGPISLSNFPDTSNGDHVEKYPGELVFPLVSEAPHFSIKGGGALYNLVSTYGEYDNLKERSLSIEYGVQEPGSVLGPIWGPTNHMLYYFTKGSARYQIVSPITSKLEADVLVYPGQVVAIPASYGFVIIAGTEGVEYFTFADVSNPTGGSLYASFLDYPKELVAAAFCIPESSVDSFVGKRDHNIILPAYKRITTTAVQQI